MPILTTLLLYKENDSLQENMAKFKEMIKLDSLTQSELYVKNAMKSQEMHQKGIEIISNAMSTIMQTQQMAHEAKIKEGEEGNNPLREINVDSFMQRLN